MAINYEITSWNQIGEDAPIRQQLVKLYKRCVNTINPTRDHGQNYCEVNLKYLHSIIIALAQDNPIGFMGLTQGHRNKFIFTLDCSYVEPEFRQQKIWDSMADQLIERAISQNALHVNAKLAKGAMYLDAALKTKGFIRESDGSYDLKIPRSVKAVE